jgi:hypothetical protein
VAKDIARSPDKQTDADRASMGGRELVTEVRLGKSQSTRASLATLAVIWFVLAASELGLSALISRSALYSSDLPAGGRLLLVCHSLALLTFFLLLAAIAVMPFGSIFGRVIPEGRGPRLLARIVLTIPVWLLLILYGASWGLFWQTGSFIGSGVFLFIAPHPLQVFHWVDFDLAFGIVALAGLLAFTFTCLIPRWTQRRSAATHNRLLLMWKWAVGFSVLGSLLGIYYGRGDERQSVRAGIIYSRNQENRSGPFSFLVADLTKRFGKASGDLSIDQTFQFALPRSFPSSSTKRRPSKASIIAGMFCC